MAAKNDPLKRYLRVQRDTDAELKATLERAARDARAQIRRTGGNTVRKAQLERVIKQIQRAQRAMWTEEVLGITQRGRGDAIQAAQNAADALTRELYHRLPARQARGVEAGLNLTASEGMEAEKARVPRQLSAAVVGNNQLAQRRMDKLIRSGLVRGLSAEELAAEVYQFISPTVPGGASYAALRLARTEINNAFHQRQIENGRRPGVEGIKWNLSGSHTVPDECNRLAGKVFKPDDVPDKPHPQCFCYLTYEMDSLDDFLEQIQNGDFDELLDDDTVASLEESADTRNNKIDHSGHNHPATPKARGACRAHGGTTQRGWPPHDEDELVREPERAPEPEVRGTPASQRDPEWLSDDLHPHVAHAARNAYDASNNLVPRNAAFRIRSVSTYNRRNEDQQRFRSTMDRGAYAACSGGHIVVTPGLETRRRAIRDARENGRFIGHRGHPDELETSLAHEMGHALTVGMLDNREVADLLDATAETFGWDPVPERHRSEARQQQFERMLDTPQRRRQFEKKFGKYAASHFDEFLAEVWCVYALDPEKCDADVKRIGELMVEFIDFDPAVLIAETMARLERERKEREGK